MIWTFERLMLVQNAYPLLDFSNVHPVHFDNGHDSQVPCVCRVCRRAWSLRIGDISDAVCSRCPDRKKWTFDNFKKQIHKIVDVDFSLVKKEDLRKRSYSNIPCICRLCGNTWTPNISSLFAGTTGCSNCPINRRWTLNRLKIAKQIRRGIKFVNVTEDGLQHGNRSLIECLCRHCGCRWKQQIGVIFRSKCYCPMNGCNTRVPARSRSEWLYCNH